VRRVSRRDVHDSGELPSPLREDTGPPVVEEPGGRVRRFMPTTRSRGILSAALLLSLLQSLIVLVDVDVPGRTWTALAVALLVPGVPAALWLRLPSLLASAGIAVAVSIATQILVSMAMLQTGWWHPVMSVLVPTLSAVLIAVPIWRRPVPVPDELLVPVAAVPLSYRLREAGPTPWLLLAALLLYLQAVTHTDQDLMTAYALISVMPLSYVLALACIAAAAGIELSQERQRERWLLATTVTLIIVLFTYQNGSDEVAGFPTSWLHAGFTDYIRTYGAILPNFDARFSWPGFFAATANLSVSAGIPDATGLLRWAPLVYNLLYLIPLLLLARRVGRRRRYAWLAVMLFFSANWFEQDYFSPQATNLMLYLVLVSVLLWLGLVAGSPVDVRIRDRISQWWHDGPRTSARRLLQALVAVRPDRAPGVSARQYVAVGAIFVLSIAASVVSHQLTPVVTVLALTVLALTGRTRLRFLWLAGGLLFALWFSYGATDFWLGHLGSLIGDVGQVGSSIGSGVGKRVTGSPEHLRLQYLRLATSGGFLLAAMIGLIVRRRSPWLPTFVALSFLPFALIAGQSYGGEVVVRSFLFAMPLFAVFTTDAIAPLLERLRPITRASVIAVGILVVATSLVASRGANQRYERVTPDQIAAVHALYAIAPQGATVGEFSPFNPLHLAGIGIYTYPSMSDDTCFTVDTPAGCIAVTKPDYVYFSSGQTFFGTDVAGYPADWSARAVADAKALGYTAIWASTHVTVLASPTAAKGATP